MKYNLPKMNWMTRNIVPRWFFLLNIKWTDRCTEYYTITYHSGHKWMKNFPSCTYLVIVTGPLSLTVSVLFSSFYSSSSKKELGGQQVHQRCKFFNRLIRGSKRVNNYHFSGFYQRENLSTYHKIIMMTSFQTKTFYVRDVSF